jgi:hypothetical protein
VVEEQGLGESKEVSTQALDYFKHMTTVNGAGVVALIAIYQQAFLDRTLLAATLVMLGIGVAVSILGMLTVVSRSLQHDESDERYPEGYPPASTILFFALSSATLFIGSLINLILFAVGLPVWSGQILGGVMVATGLFIIWRRRRPHPSSGDEKN